MSTRCAAALVACAWMAQLPLATAQIAPVAPPLLQPGKASAAWRVSDAERAYVAPQATARVADGPCKTFLRGGFGKKFADQQAAAGARQLRCDRCRHPQAAR